MNWIRFGADVTEMVCSDQFHLKLFIFLVFFHFLYETFNLVYNIFRVLNLKQFENEVCFNHDNVYIPLLLKAVTQIPFVNMSTLLSSVIV